MGNAYLAICYACNENCLFCPCSKEEKQKGMITDIQELTKTVDDFENKDITDVTISGGEPTLHPDFVELVSYIHKKGMKVTVLSNSEKFADENFVSKFVDRISVDSLKVITTLHSENAHEHEEANQTPDSFERSIKGLLNLREQGVRVIIKHCITRKNYKKLLDFYKYCNETFDRNVDIQLCSIDYCGIPKEELEKEKISFKELKPFLEKMLDFHIIQKQNGVSRKLYCINIPLCSCDPYYWEYILVRRKKMYNKYKDPHKQVVVENMENVGTHKEYCKDCKMVGLCGGTYFSAYSVLGEAAVSPFI